MDVNELDAQDLAHLVAHGGWKAGSGDGLLCLLCLLRVLWR